MFNNYRDFIRVILLLPCSSVSAKVITNMFFDKQLNSLQTFAKQKNNWNSKNADKIATSVHCIPLHAVRATLKFLLVTRIVVIFVHLHTYIIENEYAASKHPINMQHLSAFFFHTVIVCVSWWFFLHNYVCMRFHTDDIDALT